MNDEPSTPQEDQSSLGLETAVHESVAEGQVQEGADVQEALLRSNIESAQQQVVVVLRQTKRNARMFHAECPSAFCSDPQDDLIMATIPYPSIKSPASNRVF